MYAGRIIAQTLGIVVAVRYCLHLVQMRLVSLKGSR